MPRIALRLDRARFFGYEFSPKFVRIPGFEYSFSIRQTVFRAAAVRTGRPDGSDRAVAIRRCFPDRLCAAGWPRPVHRRLRHSNGGF